MPGMKHIKSRERIFAPLGDTGIQMGRDIWSPESSSVGCGYYTYKNVYCEWEVSYDEYMFCVSGSLTMHGDGGPYVLKPGDGIWIPKGNKVIYDCKDEASVVVAIYPADYRNSNDVEG